MYTPQQIEAMGPAERCIVLDELGAECYGKERWKSEFARDTGVTVNGIHQWFNVERSKPPVWAFILLQTMLEMRADQTKIRLAKAALADIKDALKIL